jgi:hypothetical protein
MTIRLGSTPFEYQEVLRKKYGLPDDWKPEPIAPLKIRRSHVADNPAFLEMAERNEYLEPEEGDQ